MAEMTSSFSLQSMLSSIVEERQRDMLGQHPYADSKHITGLATFWTNLFKKCFLDIPDDGHRDDMLFYVRQNQNKYKFQTTQSPIEVFRRSSQRLPVFADTNINWEETVYLNLIMQYFEYFVTCAICSRTGAKELQILKKCTQQVYPTPSTRKMDRKGIEEEITYPNIFFTIDDYEEVFRDHVVRDSEMVCVELVARDRAGNFQGVIFLGSVRYDLLKQVYDARASLTHRMAQKMALGGWFKENKRVEFIRMRGPKGKGYAEMAISRVKGTGQETPAQTPNADSFSLIDFEENESSHRRLSDPSSSWSYYGHGSLKKSHIRKSQSHTENVDPYSGCAEVEAGDLEDEFDEESGYYNALGRSFGQAWHWFKEHRRSNSVALNSYLTYITLPWHRIIADLLDVKQEPVLSFEIM